MADSVLSTLQSVFLENRKVLSNILTANAIKIKGPTNIWNLRAVTLYMIKYSPAAIFSGNIPALDINFFNPKGTEGKVDVQKTKFEYAEIGSKTIYQQCKDTYGAPDGVNVYYDRMSTSELVLRVLTIICIIDAIEAIGNFNIGGGLGEVEMTVGSLISAVAFGILAGFTATAANVIYSTRQTIYWRMWQNEVDKKMYFWISTKNQLLDNIGNLFTDDIENKSGTLYEIRENIQTYEHESTAYTLRNIIASWYNAFRMFALIALLSILLYIGIKIIVSSSSAEKKAKYKTMLLDWLTAVCILFVLHYIMAFVLDITQKLIKIFTVSSMSEGGVDYLMTTIRNSIVQENGSQFKYWGYAVMYIALVILTVAFTLQYIKRLIFIALLTMIAPLIALTYPLDKIRDGQAQGFTLWVREYVFNCLIQPLHLLLYTMIVNTAIQTMKNPIIAIIALSLFNPTENFLRKMFGFDKATTLNNIGAIAGGAMVMNMLNKLPKTHQNGSKENSKDSEKTSSIRMNNNENNNSSQSENGGSATSNNVGNGPRSTSNSTSNRNGNSTNSTGNRKNGYRALRQRAIKNGANALASVGRWTTRTAMKIGGGFAGATLGVATGMADGEIGLPVKNIAAGTYIGSTVGKKFVGTTDKILKKTGNGLGKEIDEVRETYQRGAMGEEAYNKYKAKNTFYSSKGWNEIEKDSSISGDKKERTEEFLDNGIYDAKVIKEALQNNISAQDYAKYTETGIGSVSDMKKLQDVGITPQDYKEFKTLGIKDVDKIARVKSKHRSEKASNIASCMAIAQYGQQMINDPVAFVKFAKSVDPRVDAEELLKEIGSYIL